MYLPKVGCRSIESTDGKVSQIAIPIRSFTEQTRMRRMILKANPAQNGEQNNSSDETKRQSTSLISRLALLLRLRRGKEARAKFVESHLDKSIAFQIRSLRSKEQWTQGEFAAKLGIKHQNNVSARLENPNYGKHSLTTLKKIAATCDVALVVWFVPFSRFLDWMTGTPFTDKGLTEDFYSIPTFKEEFGNPTAMGSIPSQPIDNAENQCAEKSEGAADLANVRIPPDRDNVRLRLLRVG